MGLEAAEEEAAGRRTAAVVRRIAAASCAEVRQERARDFVEFVEKRYAHRAEERTAFGSEDREFASADDTVSDKSAVLEVEADLAGNSGVESADATKAVEAVELCSTEPRAAVAAD